MDEMSGLVQTGGGCQGYQANQSGQFASMNQNRGPSTFHQSIPPSQGHSTRPTTFQALSAAEQQLIAQSRQMQQQMSQLVIPNNFGNLNPLQHSQAAPPQVEGHPNSNAMTPMVRMFPVQQQQPQWQVQSQPTAAQMQQPQHVNTLVPQPVQQATPQAPTMAISMPPQAQTPSQFAISPPQFGNPVPQHEQQQHQQQQQQSSLAPAMNGSNNVSGAGVTREDEKKQDDHSGYARLTRSLSYKDDTHKLNDAAKEILTEQNFVSPIKFAGGQVGVVTDKQAMKILNERTDCGDEVIDRRYSFVFMPGRKEESIDVMRVILSSLMQKQNMNSDYIFYEYNNSNGGARFCLPTTNENEAMKALSPIHVHDPQTNGRIGYDLRYENKEFPNLKTRIDVLNKTITSRLEKSYIDAGPPAYGYWIASKIAQTMNRKQKAQLRCQGEIKFQIEDLFTNQQAVMDRACGIIDAIRYQDQNVLFVDPKIRASSDEALRLVIVSMDDKFVRGEKTYLVPSCLSHGSQTMVFKLSPFVDDDIQEGELSVPIDIPDDVETCVSLFTSPYPMVKEAFPLRALAVIAKIHVESAIKEEMKRDANFRQLSTIGSLTDPNARVFKFLTMLIHNNGNAQVIVGYCNGDYYHFDKNFNGLSKFLGYRMNESHSKFQFEQVSKHRSKTPTPATNNNGNANGNLSLALPANNGRSHSKSPILRSKDPKNGQLTSKFA